MTRYVFFLCAYDVCKVCLMFFCKQKTAYEMRISDWSSDVCSSDLQEQGQGDEGAAGAPVRTGARAAGERACGRAQVDGRLGRPVGADTQIGRASCRERVCQEV